METSYFNTSDLDTNLSSEETEQHFRSVRVQLALEQGKHLG